MNSAKTCAPYHIAGLVSPTRAFHHQRTSEYLSRRSVSSSSDLLQNKLRKLLNDQGPNRTSAPLSIFQQPIEPIESPTRLHRNESSPTVKFKNISQSPKRKNPEVSALLLPHPLQKKKINGHFCRCMNYYRLSYHHRLKIMPTLPHSSQVHFYHPNHCPRKMCYRTRTVLRMTMMIHCF